MADRESEKVSPPGNVSACRADASKTSTDVNTKNGKESDSAIRSKNGTNAEVVSVVEASSTNNEIASSAMGDVKLSLSCDHKDFHMPNLESVFKMVVDRCLKSNRIIEPSFFVMNLTKEKPPCTPDIRIPKVPRLMAMNGLQLNMQPDPKASGDNETERAKKKIEHEVPEPVYVNSHSLVVVQHEPVLGDVRSFHDVNDIAKGEERVRISLVNEVSIEQFPPSFYYIPRNLVYKKAYLNFSLARIRDGDCCSECFGNCLSASIPCACARETGGEYGYTRDGLLKNEFLDDCISMNSDPQKHRLFYCKDCPLERSRNEVMPHPCKGHLVRKFIKECWIKCGCNKQCGNRVVQRGITCNLQVFFTSEGKGWGLRTLDDLPCRAFVCEYVGEVLTNLELYDRIIQTTDNVKHTYPVLLDADWGSEGVSKDEEALCLDATFYGNVARFINHRCFDANLVEVPVEVETSDHHYYHLALFTTRKIEAFEELTWDYGIDFDDHARQINTFRCLCGSNFCRDKKRSCRKRSCCTI